MIYGKTEDEQHLQKCIDQIPTWRRLLICLMRWKFWKIARAFNRVEATLLNAGHTDYAEHIHAEAVRYWHYVYSVPFLADEQKPEGIRNEL